MTLTDSVAEQVTFLLHDEEEPLPMDTIQLLQSIIHNIVVKPNEAKFKKIPLTNAKVAERIVKYENAMALLYLLGFEVLDGDENILTLPDTSVNMESLRTVLKIIQDTLNVPQPTASTTFSSCCNKTQDEKDVEIEKRKKEILEKQRKEKLEREKLRERLKKDKEERKYMAKGLASVGRKLERKGGANVNRFSDVGVDLNKQQGG
jgi:hypothetical protein